MLKHIRSSLIVFFFCALTAFAEETATVPKIYTCGVFINRICSFEVVSGTAVVDFWYWAVSTSADVSLQNLELSNGQAKVIGEEIKQDQDGLYYVSCRYVATVNCQIDTTNFPFDAQVIPLIFEDSQMTADQLVFQPDKANSGIDPSFKMNNWLIQSIGYNVATHHYPSSFGYLDIPSGQGSDYSQLIVEITLNRRGSIFQKILKFFWAMGISVLVGLFALLIRIRDLAARFGMATGALFANVGCSYLLAEQLPQSPSVSLAEKAGYLSLGFILFTLIVSILSLGLFHMERENWSRRLDRSAFCVGISSYLLMWAFMLW